MGGLNPNFKPPAGARQNEFGSWVDANGDLLRTETGDYQFLQPNNLHAGYEKRDTGKGTKDLWWNSQDNVEGGKRQYARPQDSMAHYMEPSDSGGAFHSRGDNWNSRTGKYEEGGLDWGKIGSWIVGGGLGLGAASAFAGGGAAASTVPTALEEGGVGAGGAASTAAAAAPTVAGPAGGATAGGSSILGKVGWAGGAKLADVLTHAAGSGQDQENKSDIIKNSAERNRLDRDKYALVAPGQRLHDSTIASFASSASPTRVNWGPEGFHPGAGLRGQVPHFEGGFTGGLEHLDPATRELARLVIQDELASQRRGGSTGGNHDLDGPELNVDHPSGTDRALGSAGLVTSILSAIYGGQNKPKSTNPAGSDYPKFWEDNG